VPLTLDHLGRLDGPQVRRLMRARRRTIRGLADAMGLPMTRVRAARASGTYDHYQTRDWVQAITGRDPGHCRGRAEIVT
jgi:hypothetical protein